MVINEVYEINGYASPIIDDFFIFWENTHNLRNFQIILNKSKKTVRYVSETMSCRTFPLGKSPRTSGRCLFCFGLKIPFLGKFGPKTQNCQFELEFGIYLQLIQIWWTQWWCSLFLLAIRNTYFGKSLFQILKLLV